MHVQGRSRARLEKKTFHDHCYALEPCVSFFFASANCPVVWSLHVQGSLTRGQFFLFVNAHGSSATFRTYSHWAMIKLPWAFLRIFLFYSSLWRPWPPSLAPSSIAKIRFSSLGRVQANLWSLEICEFHTQRFGRVISAIPMKSWPVCFQEPRLYCTEVECEYPRSSWKTVWLGIQRGFKWSAFYAWVSGCWCVDCCVFERARCFGWVSRFQFFMSFFSYYMCLSLVDDTLVPSVDRCRGRG